MKKVSMLALLFSLLLSTTCFAVGVDWNSNTISAVGVGSAPDSATKEGPADALARRAAVVDAYRNLASIVYGVEIENHTTVEQLAVKKDTIKTSVSGVISNARIVDEEKLDDGNYQITISMPIFGAKNSLASAVWQNDDHANDVTVPVAPPTTTSPVTNPIPNDRVLPIPPVTPAKTEIVHPGSITGVIIDCRGLGLERAMAPNVLDTTGRSIYNSKDVDNDIIIKKGLATYSKTDDPTKITAAGINPLLIKAKSVQEFNRNPVISKEDGDKILAANQEYNFLRNCSVVFIQ
ncbi:MAG: Lipoprotein LPP20-like [Firmicutes bacterium]|nr:Lipoprotein LPP20-like [Bacillota bacterium]